MKPLISKPTKWFFSGGSEWTCGVLGEDDDGHYITDMIGVTLDDEALLPVQVYFDHQRDEPAARDYPGCQEVFTINDVVGVNWDIGDLGEILADQDSYIDVIRQAVRKAEKEAQFVKAESEMNFGDW